ncbi:MAG: hypothetical protein QNJ55_28995 [Xenococcus sp. MO_188.B8]|nr:hypothetical protein [Xenococcus sp. MO_188.B8]
MTTITILAIDSDYDSITQSAYEYRQKSVYPYLEELGFEVKYHRGQSARRYLIAPVAQERSIVYITGSGHGHPREFTGDYGCTIFKVGHYSKEESQEKIIHLLSCYTARELGLDMAQNGCRAFFGYDDPFYFVLNFSEVFWELDSEIDRAFAEVMSAEEVYDRVSKLYQQRIQEYTDMWATAIMNEDDREGDQETVNVMYELYEVIKHLKGNYRHLCCPSVNPKWGRIDVGFGKA